MAAQRGDIIYVNGEKMELFSNPLEDYWVRYKKRRPSFFSLDVLSRGYVATWEIRDAQLFLTALDGEIKKKSFLLGKRSVKCSLKTIFSKSKTEVKAVWFSGKLRIPRGNMTQFEDSGYNSRFERELIITIDKGEVIKMCTLDYTQKRLIVMP